MEQSSPPGASFDGIKSVIWDHVYIWMKSCLIAKMDCSLSDMGGFGSWCVLNPEVSPTSSMNALLFTCRNRCYYELSRIYENYYE